MTDQTAAQVKVSNSKVIIAKVVSDKMDKTRVVQYQSKEKHPLYGKYVVKYTKMYVHDDANLSKIGDIVEIQQTRPLSKKKRWKLLSVVERAK